MYLLLLAIVAKIETLQPWMFLVTPVHFYEGLFVMKLFINTIYLEAFYIWPYGLFLTRKRHIHKILKCN